MPVTREDKLETEFYQTMLDILVDKIEGNKENLADTSIVAEAKQIHSELRGYEAKIKSELVEANNLLDAADKQYEKTRSERDAMEEQLLNLSPRSAKQFDFKKYHALEAKASQVNNEYLAARKQVEHIKQASLVNPLYKQEFAHLHGKLRKLSESTRAAIAAEKKQATKRAMSRRPWSRKQKTMDAGAKRDANPAQDILELLDKTAVAGKTMSRQVKSGWNKNFSMQAKAPKSRLKKPYQP